MQILHVIHSLDPRSGGPSHAIRHLVREQVRAGHEVTLVATDRQSAEPWEDAVEYVNCIAADPAFAGAEVFVGRAFGRRGPWLRYGWSPDCRKWLVRRMADRASRPRIVHIHGAFAYLTSVAAKTARRYGVPYIVRTTGCLDASCFQSGHQWLKRLFTRLSLRRDIQHAACLHATSTDEAGQLRQAFPDTPTRIVPLGAEVPEVDLQRAARSLLDHFPQLRDRPVVLYMSRIAPKKRLELLVEAMAVLCGDVPDICLLVAGQDAGHLPVVRDTVRRLKMEETVVFAGFLQGPLKHGAMATARLFALPSIDENFGVAVVEAMAHGLPVLVTPGVASHEYVDRSGGGMTVEGTVDALVDGIRQLLDGDCAAMGQRGKAFVQQHLSWPAVVSQLDDLYKEILA
ncbi:MAG: glycosyltransferase [Planctomycetes bacterium]|nr:glycosyltransferase [Planctomycetota bacterium]